MSLEPEMHLDQNDVLTGFVDQYRSQIPIDSRPAWPSVGRTRIGQLVPIIRQCAGRPRIDKLRLGWKSPSAVGLSAEVPSEGQDYSRRCLVPVSTLNVEGLETAVWGQPAMGGSEHDARSWFMVGGIWREEDRQNPETFQVLTIAAVPSVADRWHRQPLLVDPTSWSDWLDPEKDMRPLQQRFASKALSDATA
jgi:putative SOS response-associated peptidase YedK